MSDDTPRVEPEATIPFQVGTAPEGTPQKRGGGAKTTAGREARCAIGSERPAAEGDDEAAWAKNRRVEVVYLP